MYSLLICGQIQSRLSLEKRNYFKLLRKALPEVEIVVSTWPGEFLDRDRKFIDTLVVNPDPGDSRLGKNFRRIAVSTNEAIRKASGRILIRSRIEVEVSHASNFSNLLSLISQMQTSKIFFPVRVSQFLYEKGLIFAWPDFFQIANAETLAKYWDCNPETNSNNRFHMTSGNNNSLCSDQVLALNYADNILRLDLFSNRNYFSQRLWNSYRSFQERNILYFDEVEGGLDFGRLQRNGKYSLFHSLILSPDELPLGTEKATKFLLRRVYKEFKRQYYYPSKSFLHQSFLAPRVEDARQKISKRSK
jgi:hypothetical protein